MNPVIVENISKSYGATQALRDLSFEVAASELFGFIGPDGAGKTTLFRILTTVLLPDKGRALVEGLDTAKDFKKIRRHLGYMPGRFSLYQDLSIEENLNFFASIFNTTIKENYHLIKDIYEQIEPFKKRKAGKLSGGMKQKLALCCALIHKPKVLILDEPTTGVDAVSRQEFWEMLRKLKSQGITILVSTPYMDEASLCEKVALIQHGKILDINTPDNIVRGFAKRLFAVKSDDLYKLSLILKEYEHANSVYPFGEYLHYTDKRDDVSKEIIEDYLKSRKMDNAKVKIISANIEDSFMALMKGNSDEP